MQSEVQPLPPIGHYMGGLTEDSAPIVGNKMIAYVSNLILFLF